jgi:ABC-type multidrug transport system permease subunit
MGIVAFGYALGVLHKIFYRPDWVIWLYVLNCAMVSFDLFLYFRFSAEARRAAARP